MKHKDAADSIVVPRAGDRLWVVDTVYTFKATGAETGGTYAAVECPLPPGCGTPPHTHTREDEAFYVLEGEVQFLVEGETIDAKTGDFVHGARNVQHCFANVSGRPARLLIVAVPAGIEAFFAAIGDPVTDSSGAPPAVDMARILAAAPAYGIRIHL